MIENRRYFKTFDALRFLAFFKVFIFHIPIIGFPLFDFLKSGGGTAVSFFFSLSGFLITYIILEEKAVLGTFSIKAFFLKRMLRIWPLYYIMVAFAFVTPTILSLISIGSSSDGYEPNWLMSVLFLENYKMIATNDFPNVSPLTVMWSLCVEEHFYIIWSLALYWIPIRSTHWLIVVSIVVAICARYVFYLNGWPFLDVFTNIDYFAFGAIPAILLIRKRELTEVFLKSIPFGVKIMAIVTGVIVFLLLPNLEYALKSLIEPTILGAIFLLVLTLVVFDESTFGISDKNILSRLGIYTYGLYLTHTIVINLFVKIFDKMGLLLSIPIYSIVFVCVCFIGTLVASIVSYYLIERPFLNLKKWIR